MRRVMFTVAASVLLAGAVPATALAHHKHHSKHHARTHHAKIRRFGDQSSAPTSTSSSDNAGTVQRFQNGVLTIALNDGSTVKGAVTNDTELECTAPQQSSTIHDEGDGGSGDQSSGDDNQASGGEDRGDDNQASGGEDRGDDNQNETQGEDQNETQGEDQNENEANNCSTSSLTSGAVVHEASLRISGSGAVWQKVELVS